jgi:hypothetical protein
MSAAGEEAVRYFERTNPDYPRFGAGSTSDNTAEWIVDLTTKVPPEHETQHAFLSKCPEVAFIVTLQPVVLDCLAPCKV